MKKILVLSLGLLFLSAAGRAQARKNTKAREAQYTTLGPAMGMGHSWLSGVHDQVVKPSGYLGISFIYSRFEHWGWGADLAVSHEGFRIEAPNGVNRSIDPAYLRITPKAYYFFGNYGNACRPKLFAGPSLAYKLNEDHYYDGEMLNGDAPQGHWYHGRRNVFDDVDAGILVGGGLNIHVAKSLWLNLDGSYYHGLVDVTGYDDANRNLRFNMGLMFGL